MPINYTYKSNRLLQSRRYTHDSLTDAQESFTSTLDINANEVYVDQALIPSASLPFSGSGQSGSIYSVGGQNVMKYYYRQPMTKSDLNNEVWFFLDPTGSSAGIGAQLIDGNQLGDFISPKYAVSALANANTEDATPGYGVRVYVTGSAVSVNNYAFDYKTGVLQFVSASYAPAAGQALTITAYRYVGRKLSDNITNVSASILAISQSIGSGGSLGSRVDQLAAATASVNTFTASINGHVSNINAWTASTNTWTASTNTRLNVLEASGSIQSLGTSANVTFNTLTTSNNLTVGGDLVVQGNTVTLNVAELVVEDKLINLASGSTTPTQANGAGIAINGASASFTYDSTPNAWTTNIPISSSAVTASVNVPGYGTSKRMAFRDTTGNLNFIAAPTTTGDVVQWDGTNFVMSNTIDGGTF